MVGRNVGTFLQPARSGHGCSTRASAGDRAVAAQGGLASLRVALFAAKGKFGQAYVSDIPRLSPGRRPSFPSHVHSGAPPLVHVREEPAVDLAADIGACRAPPSPCPYPREFGSLPLGRLSRASSFSSAPIACSIVNPEGHS